MKLINQYDYGLCLYFDYFSPFDFVTGNGQESIVSESYLYQGRFQKQKFAKVIHEEIRDLLMKYPATARYLPESICQYAESGTTSEGLSLLALHWIARLQYKTRTKLEKIRYELNDCVSRIGGQAGSILENMAGRRYTTVSAVIEGDNLMVSLPAYEWGRAKLIFPQVHVTSGELKDINKGLLFLMEGSYSDETGFNFSLLINQENSDTLLDDRLLTDAGWCDVTFSSEKPYAEVAGTDYAHAFSARGYSGYGLYTACCDQLVKKARILGMRFLDNAEARLYTLAEFWRALGLVEDERGVATFDDNFVMELLDNRYGFESVICLLEDMMEIPSCGSLLRQAVECVTTGDKNSALVNLFNFYKYIKALEKTNKLHRFGERAAEVFAAASGVFPVNHGISTSFFIAKQQVVQVIEPWLSVLGFSGVFPHYRRLRHGHADYVTVSASRIFESAEGGETFCFSLEGARVHVQHNGGAPPMADGIYYDRLTANDYAQGDGFTRYVKIATEEDGGVCKITCGGKETGKRIVTQGLHLLPEYLKVLDCALKKKFLPHFYASYLVKRPGSSRTLGRTFLLGCGVFLLYLIVAAMLFFGRGGSGFDTMFAYFADNYTAIGIGGLGVSVAMLGVYFLRRHSLWQSHRRD